jgi:hypothetical protein
MARDSKRLGKVLIKRGIDKLKKRCDAEQLTSSGKHLDDGEI